MFHVGKEIIEFEAVGSTNDVAWQLVEKGAFDGTVVVAKTQTEGRGRRGNQWFSPRGGLWLSIIMTWNRPGAHVLGPSVALAVVDFLKGEGLTASIKWPNDIYLYGKKVGGILIEARGQNVVIGVGLNLTVSEFPPELSAKAGSIFCTLGCEETETRKRLDGVLACLSRRLAELKKDGFAPLLDDIRSNDMLVGKVVDVIVEGDRHGGRVLGIDMDGRLVLDVAGQRKIFLSGEVSIQAWKELQDEQAD